MTTDEQLAAIRANTFFTALKTQFQAIIADFTAQNFTVGGEIVTEVAGVPVTGILHDTTDIEVHVGVGDQGQPLYVWTAPQGWLQ